MPEVVITLIFALLILIPVTLITLLFRYANREARHHNGQCKACGYNLQGLPNPGQCPECGQPYTHPKN